MKNGGLKILNLTRSSVESTKMAVAEQLKSVFELAGMQVDFSGSYPGWKPKPGAEIIKIMTEIYEKDFGAKTSRCRLSCWFRMRELLERSILKWKW